MRIYVVLVLISIISDALSFRICEISSRSGSFLDSNLLVRRSSKISCRLYGRRKKNAAIEVPVNPKDEISQEQLDVEAKARIEQDQITHNHEIQILSAAQEGLDSDLKDLVEIQSRQRLLSNLVQDKTVDIIAKSYRINSVLDLDMSPEAVALREKSEKIAQSHLSKDKEGELIAKTIGDFRSGIEARLELRSLENLRLKKQTKRARQKRKRIQLDQEFADMMAIQSAAPRERARRMAELAKQELANFRNSLQNRGYDCDLIDDEDLQLVTILIKERKQQLKSADIEGSKSTDFEKSDVFNVRSMLEEYTNKLRADLEADKVDTKKITDKELREAALARYVGEEENGDDNDDDDDDNDDNGDEYNRRDMENDNDDGDTWEDEEDEGEEEGHVANQIITDEEDFSED